MRVSTHSRLRQTSHEVFRRPLSDFVSFIYWVSISTWVTMKTSGSLPCTTGLSYLLFSDHHHLLHLLSALVFDAVLASYVLSASNPQFSSFDHLRDCSIHLTASHKTPIPNVYSLADPQIRSDLDEAWSRSCCRFPFPPVADIAHHNSWHCQIVQPQAISPKKSLRLVHLADIGAVVPDPSHELIGGFRLTRSNAL